MTPRKVLARLVEFGPQVIEPWTRIPNHCVLATAIGIDVLARFNIPAEPLACEVKLANRAWLAGVAACPPDLEPDWVALGARGAWLVATDTPGLVGPGMWAGHLVISLPHMGAVLDLNLGQMNRPTKAIEVPSAALFPFTPPRVVYDLPHGCELAIQVSADTSWRGAPDWFDESRRFNVVDELTRAVRKGRV